MLAAPKKYKFGTKIYLKGLWVWEVTDRWGAIVSAWNRWYKSDRIDVWMWYWDEWLRRALYWGKRKVKWHIVNKNTKSNLNYNKIKSPFWVTLKLKKAQIIKKVDIFSWPVNTYSKIKKLKSIFKELWYYNWKINNDKESLIDSVYDFQKDNKIVKSIYSSGAGSYWPKTRKKLKSLYNNHLAKIKEEEDRIQKELALVKKMKNIKEQSLTKAHKQINYIWESKFGEVSHRVRKLQITLKELWYFNYKDTAIYWKKTKASIIVYQLKNNIIKSKNDIWAWILWPKTKKSLIQDLQNNFEKELISSIERNKI
jgi:hypothetical protein